MNGDTWIQLVVLLVAIAGVGVSLAILIQNTVRDFRREMYRIHDRINALEGNLRDRIGWIEGMLSASRRDTQSESSYRWRYINDSESKQED